MRCGHWRRLDLELARKAREKAASGCIDRAVQCQLPPHEGSDHYGFLDDQEYGTALWLRWYGSTEVRLVVLQDCPAIGPRPDEEGCCLFTDHVGTHTWQNTTEETQSTSREVQVIDVRPSQQMRGLGVVQHGAGILAEPARAFDLPAECDEATRITDELFAAMERIGRVHPFAKGMGIAAPQLGIGRAAAVVQPPGDAPAVILLNPRITTRSEEMDEQYEGCLSFFDVRGLVPRPLTITVEITALTGETITTVYERGLARLIHHEVDHLNGLLYSARMRTGVEPIPVEEYRQTGSSWVYDGT
jgi:peptide deformylase